MLETLLKKGEGAREHHRCSSLKAIWRHREKWPSESQEEREKLQRNQNHILQFEISSILQFAILQSQFFNLHFIPQGGKKTSKTGPDSV